jgi:hypothetical protein
MRPLLVIDDSAVEKIARIMLGFAEERAIRVGIKANFGVIIGITEESYDLIKKALRNEFEDYEGLLADMIKVVNAVTTDRGDSLKEFFLSEGDLGEEERRKYSSELDRKFGIVAEVFQDTYLEREVAVKNKTALPVFWELDWQIGSRSVGSETEGAVIKTAILNFSVLSKVSEATSYLAGNHANLTMECTLSDIEEIINEFEKIRSEIEE